VPANAMEAAILRIFFMFFVVIREVDGDTDTGISKPMAGEFRGNELRETPNQTAPVASGCFMDMPLRST
jgi:hypothetical protein